MSKDIEPLAHRPERTTPSRRARIFLGWFGVLIGLAGMIGIVAERRAATRQKALLTEQAARFRASEQRRKNSGAIDPVISWEGRTFRAGDRIRIAKWAGTFKPHETGAPVEIDSGRGQTGIVIRGERRASTDYMKIDPQEPIQIVRVRWLPQKWKVNLRDRWIELPAFEATIHVSYLEGTQ